MLVNLSPLGKFTREKLFSQALSPTLVTFPATRHRRVDKRSAVHQRWRRIRWTALSLVHPTTGIMIKALSRFTRNNPMPRHDV